MRVCSRCGAEAEFAAGLGWIHRGGGHYVMTCSECGWRGSPPLAVSECPNCGSRRGLRDDHCIQLAP